MSLTITATRPSSLPLPKTLSHSDPAARFLQKRAGLAAGLAAHEGLLRTKLHSTSSTGGSPTPGTSPAGTPTANGGVGHHFHERQVKSLTPERDAHSVRACQPVRKVSSTRALVIRNNSVKRATSVCGVAPKVALNNNNNIVTANNNNNNSISSSAKLSQSKTKGEKT